MHLLASLLLGLGTGALAHHLVAPLARFEIPLTSGNLSLIVFYLIAVRGLLEEALKLGAARLVPAAPPRRRLAALLLMSGAFAVGLSIHGHYLARPHRLVQSVLLNVLVSAPWIVAVVRDRPARRLVLHAGWRHGLIAILDREAGLAAVVLALLALQLLRDATRAIRDLLIECR